jgi:cytochrome c biogenesis protein CcdA/DsbC/DsbD-like thiol-disulfide interchange protein
MGGGEAQAQLMRPPTADVLPLVEADGAEQGTVMRAAILVRLPEGLHTNANQPRDPSLIPIVLSVDAPTGISVEEIVYPEPTDLVQEGVPEPLAVYEREFLIGVQLRLTDELPLGTVMVPGSLRYQACDERVCYIPTTVPTSWTFAVVPEGQTVAALDSAMLATIPFGTGSAPPAPATVEATPALFTASADPLVLLDDFTQLASTGGYLGREAFLGFILDAESGVAQVGWFEGRGLFGVLLIVLLGGLALNLTPCVLPMIPINLAIIGAGAQAGSRRRGFLLGSAYGAAMALVYGVLGLVVILTAGTFGTINASPWFNAAIAGIFVVLGLAMFDVFTIDFSQWLSRFNVREAGRGSFLVAFGMGSVAALLAGACVAPVVIQVVLFSSSLYTAGNTAALALPFLLGLGMALPWPVAGAGISAMPTPGAWMVHVKHAFGVLILGTAVYYGYLGYSLFADRWVDASEVTASVEQKLKEGWHASLAEGLAVAEREQKPVLVDMWATWCKNCLTMDATTLADPTVVAALDGYVRVKFQAEDPDEPTVREVMRRFGAIGLPTYVILEPKTTREPS